MQEEEIGQLIENDSRDSYLLDAIMIGAGTVCAVVSFFVKDPALKAAFALGATGFGIGVFADLIRSNRFYNKTIETIEGFEEEGPE